MDGYTYQDLFDTQDALDTGILNQVKYGTQTRTGSDPFRKMFQAIGIPGGSATKDLMANKDTLGSMLGQSDAIAAYKKRKLEQQKMAQAGVGVQQSILGGGAF